MQGKLAAIAKEIEQNLINSNDSKSLEALRVSYLGKKGKLTDILKGLSALPANERPVLGQAVNKLKQQLQQDINAKEKLLADKEMQAKLLSEKIDVSLPGKGLLLGSSHPVTKTLQHIEKFFLQMGFMVADGPEIEDDYHNFKALNIPDHHPARDSQDTFYFDPNTVLRTQTSGVQIRVMEQQKPPIKVIAPGKVFRCDSDLTHTPMFHQVEGLWVDEGISFGHLKGVLNSFISYFFGKEVKTRFRPSYFPFTEPSAEVDVQCVKCSGKGCRICGHTGWLEVLGCGMVHPNVLANVNIDHEKYSGFAFGVGVERLTMLKYEINDLRQFFTNDIRFLQQFKG